MAKTREAGHPASFYEGLIKYLKSRELVQINMWVKNGPNKKVKNSDIKKALEERPLVDYFTLERFADEYKKHSWSIPKKYTIKKNGESYVYVLDSAVLRSTNGSHFSAYITCNGKSYGFDGESFARMTLFEWKKHLNKDIEWRFAEQYDTYFNFQRGYFMLFYYRT
jgi:hypothetical protein